jgi:PAS domain S-box-containing protein
MSILAVLPPFGVLTSALLDATAMVLLISPMLYFFAFRPLVGMLREREDAAEALRQANEQLDSRIRDRTASLQIVNEEMQREIAERKKAEAELQRARDELELRVRERTADLEQANSQLRSEVAVRRQKEADLSAAELRYRTVAEFTYDWEYWLSADGLLLYCSPSCERISGYRPDELAADPTLIERMVHPEDRDTWQEHACRALTKPGPKTILFRILTKSGAIRWIEHVCQPVNGGRDEPSGVRAGNRDVTDRKQAEMETQHLREELARVSRFTTAGQLAAALAHELNQPLAAVVCNVQAAEQYLSQASPPLDEVREILRDIEADGKRAGEVIYGLRALYQKTGRGRTALQFNRIIQETTDLLHSEFVLKGVAVELQRGPSARLWQLH